ncbi:hypothetical protein LTR56_016515 [Elasticomyces elasticus]|nr:hypothetical protein LTR22_021914 [Elasticomyces elasticus]KAK3632147.1 hypothetical protein LTR56_016515 [Elasticomyces elasticus]KAK4923711.1 hypothetical protein LTR49_009068 [Elasticomyces elasticus]KAK5757516.1 hypothetical protein LTS12_012335 [Elasticomyces elasticus]
MLLPRISALLLAASTVHALKDAYPFLMLPISQDDLSPPQSRQIATATDVETDAIAYLSASGRERSFLFTQPGLQAEDFQHMPKLRRRVEGISGGQLQVPEVIGGARTESIVDGVAKWMGAEKVGGMRRFELAALEAQMRTAERVKEVKKADDHLDQLLSGLEVETKESYIFIYTGAATARSSTEEMDLPYEMDEPYPTLHTDLKRDTRTYHVRASNSSAENPQSGLPLFEKYQFLSPALFMGLTVSLILFFILYVGVSAIAGLEVSYAAFSKEMGPQGQNKGKQQ